MDGRTGGAGTGDGPSETVVGLTDATWRRHDFYMRLAVVVESGAKCLGSRVGAAVVRDDRVLGTGYNGTPSGFPNCTEAERGCRRCALRFEESDAHLTGRLYDICLCVHAEQNALTTGARFGVPVEGGTLYTTLQPCFNCLKEILQVGIRSVVYRRPWQARHPDYGWVEGEYVRLVEHFRARGGLFARLEQEAALPPVEVELGRPT